MLRGLRLRELAVALLLVVVTMAWLQVDGLALLVAKLSKERIQASALTGAARISRHGYEVDAHQVAQMEAVRSIKMSRRRDAGLESNKKRQSPELAQLLLCRCKENSDRSDGALWERKGGGKEMGRGEKNVFRIVSSLFESFTELSSCGR